MKRAELRRPAVELRAELALQPTEVFDPYALATAYGVDVISLGDSPCSPAALEHLKSPSLGGLLRCLDTDR